MRIVAISGNMTACYGYRLFWPLNTLHLEDPDNYTCTITNLVDERMISGRQSNEGPADVLILSREVHGPNLVAAANMRRDYGTRIIYDVDDYLFDLPPWNPVAKWFANDNIRSNIEHFLTHCDAITVSTEPLRRAYAKYNEHIYVLPNSIWPRVPSRVRNNRLPVVGWSGAVGHDMDFARAREALEELGRTGEAFVKLFSCEDFPAGPTVYNTPYVPWKGYYQTLAALDFDIGLVPLADHRFNLSKSNIRYLEYSMAGTPTIASAVGPFATTIEHDQTGILIEDDDDWLPWIRRLLKDPAHADRLAAAAREDVLERFNISKNWKMWRRTMQEVLARPPRKLRGSYVLAKTGLMVTTETPFVRVMAPTDPRPDRGTTVAAVDPGV